MEPLGTADASDEPEHGGRLIATPAMEGLAVAGGLGAPSLNFGDARELNGARMLRRRVACTDPVQGLWVTRHHDREVNDWHFFTLEVTPRQRRLPTPYRPHPHPDFGPARGKPPGPSAAMKCHPSAAAGASTWRWKCPPKAPSVAERLSSVA